MKRRRLLLYTNSRIGGFLGGMERHMELIARLIDREKFEVFALTPDLPPLRALLELLAPHCTDVAAITFDKDHLTNLVPFARQIRRWKIDVAHLHNGHYTGYVSSILGVRLGGVRRIYMTEHTPADDPDAKRFVRNRAFMFRLIDGMVCVSQKNYEARRAVFYTPADRTFVIENGVDVDEFKPVPEPVQKELRAKHDIPDDAEVVGTVVRLEPGKGLNYLFDAFPQILAARPRALLLVVGDGSLRSSLAEQAETLGIAARVRFAGHQPDAKPYFGLFDAFVLPVPVGSMSIALLEAMAMRCACVITFGGVGEAIVHGETGFAAESRNSSSIADHVIKILRDPSVRTRLGEGARRHVEQAFSAAITARRLEELYLR